MTPHQTMLPVVYTLVWPT